MKTFLEIREAKKMKGKDPCWDNYKMIGTKEKNGKTVPNCVPESKDMCNVCGQTPCNCTHIEEETKWKVSYDVHGSNKDVPLYSSHKHVRAKSAEEAINTIKKLVGGTKHKAELVKEETKHYEEAEEHLSKANDAEREGRMKDFHAHMANHHDAMSEWHDSKGRSASADKHAEKAEQHHLKSLEHTHVEESWNSASGRHPMDYKSAYSRGKEWDEGGHDDDKHPHSVHINGKHWKTFPGRIHAARAAQTFNDKNPDRKATVVRESLDEGIARLISNAVKKVTATKPTPKQKAEIRMNKEAKDPLGGDYQASVLNLKKKAKEQEQRTGPVDLNKLRQRLAAVEKKQTKNP